MNKRSLLSLGAAIVAAVVWFAACENPANDSSALVSPVFTNADGAKEYLTAQGGGTNANTPVTLTMNIALSNNNWSDLLAAIEQSGKYVSLDLSASTKSSNSSGGGLYINGIFDADDKNNADKSRIVSITLPDEATGLAGEMSGSSTFAGFLNLRSISAANVTSLAPNAFEACAKLESASFPAAETIGNEAFWNCTSLKSANFPLADGVWMDGHLAAGMDDIWYSFSVETGIHYYIWWNDTFEGNGTKTADIIVEASYSSGDIIFTKADHAYNNPKAFTALATGTVKVKVDSYFIDDTGTFAIVYRSAYNRPK